ncbi:MAG: DUF1345 domain-containing protein [Candidatus Velthaea sp.]
MHRFGRRRLNSNVKTGSRASSAWERRLIGYGLVVLGVVPVIFLTPAWITGLTRAVVAYDAGATILLAYYWIFALRSNAKHTADRSALEDPGRNVALAIVLLSAGIGLASAVVILGQGPHVANAHEKAVAYGFGFAGVILGWFLIHSTFVFRYAHLFYYDDDEDGTAERGLIFPGTENPNDYDFAYYSFVVGMTFQVSDVQITDPGVRRVTFFHELISFGYNTAILALVVNLA